MPYNQSSSAVLFRNCGGQFTYNNWTVHYSRSFVCTTVCSTAVASRLCAITPVYGPIVLLELFLDYPDNCFAALRLYTASSEQ